MMGLYYDETHVGQKWQLGSYHFTREAVLRFAHTYDPQSFHIDDAAAAESHFGRLAASGWHTASAWMRCYVEADEKARLQRVARNEVLPEHGPSPGITNLKWIKPVYPGDTVTYWMEIIAKREMASRPRLKAQRRLQPEWRTGLCLRWQGDDPAQRRLIISR
jgi:acyl dehydratase